MSSSTSTEGDRLRQLVAFRRVVDHGSFSGAARASGVGQPAVSKQVHALETRLGIRLLQRSTTRVTLTVEGLAFYERLGPLLDQLDDLEDEVRSSAGGMRGRIVLHAPVNLGSLALTPLLLSFREAHPEVEVDARYEDRHADMVRERIDVAFRIGPFDDAGVVARRIAILPRLWVVSPTYLATHGAPKTPEELQARNLVFYANLRPGDRVELRRRANDDERRREGRFTIALRGRFVANHTYAVRDATLASAGVGLLPTWVIADELARGELLPVLTDWTVPASPLHVVHPSAGPKTRRVRALVDHVVPKLVRREGVVPSRSLRR
ncbi:MAG: LysR family transcriptional regulator [Myxococcales bacterium]|nr:LysR family transcriptional regulator [Myxococcales bacterium]